MLLLFINNLFQLREMWIRYHPWKEIWEQQKNLVGFLSTALTLLVLSWASLRKQAPVYTLWYWRKWSRIRSLYLCIPSSKVVRVVTNLCFFYLEHCLTSPDCTRPAPAHSFLWKYENSLSYCDVSVLRQFVFFCLSCLVHNGARIKNCNLITWLRKWWLNMLVLCITVIVKCSMNISEYSSRKKRNLFVTAHNSSLQC